MNFERYYLEIDERDNWQRSWTEYYIMERIHGKNRPTVVCQVWDKGVGNNLVNLLNDPVFDNAVFYRWTTPVGNGWLDRWCHVGETFDLETVMLERE